jgi:hypothetical protein
MNPINFPEANCRLLGPPGDPRVRDLDVCRTLQTFTDGAPPAAVVVSVWEPSPEERAAIAAGGLVYLVVHGKTAPPVLVLGESPFLPAVLDASPLAKEIPKRERAPRKGGGG